jgi:hypothetical protein
LPELQRRARAETEENREMTPKLLAAVLPLLGRYGASLGCGPIDGIAPSARGGTVVYERDSA